MEHATTSSLEAGLDQVRGAPSDRGPVELIVRRPSVLEREVVDEAVLDTDVGLVGDSWSQRPSSKMPDGSPHPKMQLTLMNARAAQLFAGSRDRWALAGDQLYVDLDISEANLPAGTMITVGTAVVEITDQPHTGCKKFGERYGIDAARFVNAASTKGLRLRGVNARVVTSGVVRTGDVVRKLD